MNVTVVTESRSKRIGDGLLYSSSVHLQIGDAVRVPLRGKAVTGIVTELHNDHPQAPYPLKDVIASVHRPSFLPRVHVQTALHIAKNYCVTVREALSLFMPFPWGRIFSATPVQRHSRLPLLMQLPELTDAQERALSSIQSAEKPVLLSGLPASGKSLVIAHAICKTIASGKRCILLAPDIQSSVYAAAQFEKYIGKEHICIVDGSTSPQKKFGQFQFIAEGKYSLVIGTRSALFVPLDNIGLIAIEEEHEWTYKSDRTPKIHARDIAYSLTDIAGAKLVLASSVPSLESWHRAKTHIYHHVELQGRFRDVPMPDVHILSLSENTHRSLYPLTPVLIEALRNCIAQGKQAIVFLNKTGTHSSSMCKECRERYKTVPPDRCLRCGGSSFLSLGAGTDLVLGLLNQHVPQAKVVVIAGKRTDTRILESFSRGNGDILLGTQSVLHASSIPRVTLTAVLVCDVGLHGSDFRSGERVFQHLCECIGRSGRSEKGTVYLQTFTPEAKEILCAKNFNVEGYINAELRVRQAFSYPPFSTMVSLAGDPASIHTLEKIIQRICSEKSIPITMQRLRNGECLLMRSSGIEPILPLIRAANVHVDINPLNV